jgi:hypothetical protein
LLDANVVSDIVRASVEVRLIKLATIPHFTIRSAHHGSNDSGWKHSVSFDLVMIGKY